MTTRAIFCVPKQAGLTLVEVLAGTVLLGTLLVSMLITDGRLTRQSHRTALRREACEVADTLLESWWSERNTIPREGSGEVPGRPEWQWRTHLRTSKANCVPLGQVVCIEVFKNNIDGAARPDGDEPLATVEILLYEPL